MGTVSIHLMNGFQLEKNTFTFCIDDTMSLYDLMHEWGAQEAPEALGRLFHHETGYIAPTILILLNGRSVKSDDPRKTMVSSGDRIAVTTILVGG